MKILGITTSANESKNSLNERYVRAFTTPQTTPIIVPMFKGRSSEAFTQADQDYLNGLADSLVPILDGIVLSGGNDINPVRFSEKFKNSSYTNFSRDAWEWALANRFIMANKPVIGICRGFQLLGMIYGMELTQELAFLEKNTEVHDGNSLELPNRDEPAHDIQVLGDFKEWLGTEGLKVNSWHHQGFAYENNKDIGDEIEIIAKTEKIIEGFRHKKSPVVAVQWHPEEYDDSLTIKYIINKYLL